MSEYHVCGVLLMTRPENADAVIALLNDMTGVQLHGREEGRLVVTVEGSAYGECADTITELSTLSGVASTSLVYHQVDNEQEVQT